MVGALFCPAKGRADDFEQIPEPSPSRPAIWAEAHGDFVIPVETSSLCPPGVFCVFKLGGGVGGVLGARWRRGIGLGFGYDVWFMDSDGVYDVASLQSVLAVFQAGLLPTRRLHPVIRIDGGLAMFGQTFRAQALGGIGGVAVGVEVEVTTRTVANVMLGAHFFGVQTFVSPQDGAQRGGNGVDVALTIRLGFAFVGNR